MKTKQTTSKKDCNCASEKNRGGFKFKIAKGWIAEIEGGEGRDPRHFKDMMRLLIFGIIIIVTIILALQPALGETLIASMHALIEKIT